MAKVYVTLKVMPESADANLRVIEEKAKEKIREFGGDVARVEVEPIAFGLSAVVISFFMDENKGSPDPLEETVSQLDGVMSASVTGVRRAIG